MTEEEQIRQRAYQIWEETGCRDRETNWHMAKLDIWRREYYGVLGYCPHCGTIFAKELLTEKTLGR